MEEKIRYLIRKFPSTEWSGVLFYSYQGSFETNDLLLTCQDIFPMDLGTSGWTEFHMSEDVSSYMADHIELFECQTGLVHSHHSMGAFFSGQDNLMLQQEGNDTNCFLSLVVDTRGTYVARITRHVSCKSEVTVRTLNSSYNFFGEGAKSLNPLSSETAKVIEKDSIEYFDLQVERHSVDNPLDYLDARFLEIEKKKQSASKSSTVPTPKYERPWEGSSNDRSWDIDNSSFFSYLHQKPSPEPSLFDSASKSSSPSQSWSWTPDPKKVHKAVVTILTCNFIINPDKFNLKHWVTTFMSKVYKNLFESSDFHSDECFPSAFCEWRDFILQFTLDYFDYTGAPDTDDFEAPASAVAKAISDELSEYIDVNPYVQSYCDTLSAYFV